MSKVFSLETSSRIPKAFVLRRLHSLMGIWLVIYLFEHLLVNSQASLVFQNQGNNFVRMVNAIHDYPYLPAIEILFLGVPFFVHMFWGVKYLFTSKINSFSSNGTQPSLPEYRRNQAYSWQRITSWLLLLGIIAHVVHMRFLEYPFSTYMDGSIKYIVPVKTDSQLKILSKRFNFTLTSGSEINNPDWQKYIKNHPSKSVHTIAITENAGTAFLLIVRDTFKSPAMVILYSALVLAAAFHGLNGVWTFLITWGIALTKRSQRAVEYLCWGLMAIIVLLGLMATLGTYYVTHVT